MSRKTLMSAALSTLALAGALLSPSSSTAAPASALGGHAGPSGAAIVLQNNVSLYGYDAATDAKGTTYIAWVTAASGHRVLHQCVLALGASHCRSNSSIPTFDANDADANLSRVLVYHGSGSALYFHDTTPDSVNGPRGGRITLATISRQGAITAQSDIADAPSFGRLLDAEVGPGQTLWTVADGGVGSTQLEVRPDVGAATQNVSIPFGVGFAKLTFDGNTPILVIQKYGSVTEPLRYARRTASGWTSFKPLAKTWSVGLTPGLVSTRHGVRLLTATNNASYFPVISAWTGSAFATPSLIGDNNSCNPSTHDTVTDASGRVADISNECGKLTVDNLPTGGRAALVRFSAGGTVTFIPQLTTNPSGKGWAVWSIESGSGNKLLARPLRLPDLAASRAKHYAYGGLTVTGPASCLPVISFPAHLKASKAAGWTVTSTQLKLGSKKLGSRSGTVPGGALTPDKSYRLVGTATYQRGGTHHSATVALDFRTCPRP